MQISDNDASSALVANIALDNETIALPVLDAGFASAVQIGGGSLFVGGMLLAVIALGAVGAIVASRREARAAARLAQVRSSGMRDLLRTVRMAETISGLGVWQYDCATGTQRWSDGLRSLFGVHDGEEFLAGDAETLLRANNIDLVAQVKANCQESGPFEMRFDITGYDTVERSIAVSACNLVGSDRQVERVVAVIRDITDEVKRERELEVSCARAEDEADRVRELAETDALTGLANRRRVMAELDHQVIDMRETGRSLMLVMFDIDHFKKVNDTYGHAQGDAVLKRVARIARLQAREGDLVGRIGGEEFVWIIPDATGAGIVSMSERLRAAIARGSGTTNTPPITISAGYTELRPEDTSLSLFDRADKALYEAKDQGRNQVRMAA